MESYATSEEYLKRYPDDGHDGLQTLLEDATAYIAGYLRNSGIEPDVEDEVTARNLLNVTCEVVHRRLSVPIDMLGIKQYSQTAGPFTQSGTLANPSEEMYLTSAEKRLLGIAGRGKHGAIYSIRPHIRPEASADDW